MLTDSATNYLFLDIDGVLNSREVYDILHRHPNDENDIYHLSQAEINKLNNDPSFLLGQFRREGNWGEINDKKVVAQYAKLANKLKAKVIITSNGCSTIPKMDNEERHHWCEYWSKMYNMDVLYR